MRLLTILAVLSILQGCDGSGNEPGGQAGAGGAPTGHPDAGASLEALRTTVCKTVRACCALTDAEAAPLVDCETEFDRQLRFPTYALKGTMIIDDAKMRACIARVDEQAKSCAPPLTFCYEAFQGTLGEGAPCDGVEECAISAERAFACVKTNQPTDGGRTPGTCRELTLGKKGDACAYSCAKGRNCSYTSSSSNGSTPVLTICREDDGLYCDDTLHCSAILAEGAACTFNTGCPSGTYCSTVCTPTKAAGAACSSYAECASGLGCLSGTCGQVPFATRKLCSGDYN